MKRLIAFALMFMALITFVTAQEGKPKSPKETVTGSIDGVNVEIVYSRPSARGRKMLGGNEPYGKVWRTGANEATTVKFDKNVTIEGQALPAGTYTLFTIPNENEWTFIFNKRTGQWGAYDYEENKDQDALKVNVKAGKTSAPVETFTISLDKDQVNLQWEGTAVGFKVKG